MLNKLENKSENNLESYLEVGERPWGAYYVMEDKPNFKVKKLVVKPGQRLSLQSHIHRSEHWTVVSGTATVEVRNSSNPNDWVKNLHANQYAFIKAGELHRLSNTGKIDCVLIEVQCGEYTGEDDIERFEDDYNRTKK
jgi:mannose-1-phosphate guanylyltransferase